MLKRRAIAPITSHEDLFIQRYRGLMNWALRLTEHDRQQAEDLVQDTFVHFIISRPSLERIQQNIDGYLYTMLKNLHLSEMRRTARLRDAVTPIAEFSLTDYDSVESGLKVLEEMTNAQVQVQIRDQLRRLCQYACARKSSSKAGSVLLLRFFHGYYPEEIARILRTSRPAVEDRLRAARTEARVFLEDPASLSFIDGRSTSPPRSKEVTAEDFIEELRLQIYASREGACFSRKQIDQLYRSEASPINQQVLSHFVSCPDCLDTVNQALGLPLLAERFPLSTMNKDTRKQGKHKGDGSGGAASSGGGDDLLKRVRRKAQDVLNQRPHELRISVNGIILGSQGITSRVNRQTISVKSDDRIGFVEIFSEKEVRLLFSCVEPPPDGPIEHKERVVLSDGRSLELLLDFSNSTPDLHVTYVDPLLGSEMATESAEIEAETQPNISDSRKPDAALKSTITNVRGLFLDWLGAQASRHQFGSKFLLRPGVVTALVALFLISTLLVVYRSRHVTILGPTAADLLQRSAAAEGVMTAIRDQVIHRSIILEERSVNVPGAGPGPQAVSPIVVEDATGSPAQLIARHKIEIWQSADKGITARRLYDDKGNLVAGDWRRTDGLQTLYHHGAMPQLRIRKPNPEIRNLDDAWQLSLSPSEFTSFIGANAITKLEDRGKTYVISAESADASSSVIKSAILILNRNDLHPIEQTLIITQGNEMREYRFIETVFERKPTSAVAPTLFEPERELLSSATPNTLTPTPNVSASAPGAIPASPAIATPQLELEAAYLLDQVKANLGEQISLTRTRGGQLRVEGIVETTERKNEILRALASLTNNPAVVLDVSTVAEASKRQPQSKPSSVSVERVEIQKGMAPLDADLRRYFISRGVAADKLDEEVRQFGNRMIARARQAQMHARVLKSLFERFTGEDLRALDDESRNKRMAMIRQHAEAFRADTAQLQQELEAVFFGSRPSERSEAFEINNDADLQRAVERLFELGAAHEKAMYSSFSISPEASATSVVTTPQFWQSLQSAERLAAEIQKAASSER